MGKRSRRRTREGVAPPPRPERKSAVDRFIDAGEQRPKAPWHPFPLVELCVLVGIVLLVLGLVNYREDDGPLLMLFGLVLASLGGLDTTARDHFGGFRSHSLVLAGVPAVVLAGGLFFLGAPWVLLLAVVVIAYAGAFVWFRAAFKRRAGVGFKV